MVFQSFASAKERSVILRHTLERAVADLAASRQRAAGAVAEVGRLAAEVAHEVNNPLSAVKVNVRWLAGEGAEPTRAQERAEVGRESLEAIERIAGIVQTLKLKAGEQQAAVRAAEAQPPVKPRP